MMPNQILARMKCYSLSTQIVSICVRAFTILVFSFPHSVLGADSTVPLPEMVFITGGDFEMGSLADEKSQPVHRVSLPSFYISKYEITYDEFDAFTQAVGKKSRHDLNRGRSKFPVVDVSWFDAVEYAEWLTLITGEKFRLPTEAEWEYVAKANTIISQYAWGNDLGSNRANCRDCGSPSGGESSVPVGSFEPNAFGVHDMHGNVWELTSTCSTQHYFPVINQKQKAELDRCLMVMLRGGSWETDSSQIKVWYRATHIKNRAFSDVGIRLVKETDRIE